MRDVVDYATAQHNQVAREHPELGLDVHGRINMSPTQLYAHYGFEQKDKGPGVGERQIPGLEDPQALPEPKRWEEHTPKEQARIQRAVKLKTGATMDTMERDFGSQLDQAFLRSREHGADRPYASDFYTSGEPAQVLRRTAQRTNAPLGLVAAVNADTSPQMKFRSVDRKTGHVSYPNAEQAEHAIRHVQEGGYPENISKETLTGQARAGFDKNLTKAARRADQVLYGGKTVSETYAGRSGTSGFGPKTAAYHNSWLPDTPDFLVSDRHTAHGMLAHVSPHVEQKRDPDTGEGKTRAVWDYGKKQWVDDPVYGKSPVERTVETKGYHAMADFVARKVLHSRGLGRIRQGQGAQWGEEQLQRGESGTSKQAPRVSDVYPPHPQTDEGLNSEQFHQGRMF